MLHLAVDVGGTLTAVCLFDDQQGATHVAKVSHEQRIKEILQEELQDLTDMATRSGASPKP